MKTKCTLLLIALGFVSLNIQANLIYDFGDKGGIFDNETSVGVNLTDTDTGFSTLMTVSSVGGDLNSNDGDFGVNDDAIDGTTESISLTFDRDVEFVYVDLGLVGADANDGASVTFGNFGSVDLFTGVMGFNGSQDIYTPSPSITVSSGQSVIFTGSSATSSFDLETISINVIPEPSSIALIGLSALALALSLRNRKK